MTDQSASTLPDYPDAAYRRWMTLLLLRARRVMQQRELTIEETLQEARCEVGEGMAVGFDGEGKVSSTCKTSLTDLRK